MPKASPVRKQIKLVILLSRAQVFKMFLKKVQQKFVYMCSWWEAGVYLNDLLVILL